jgi:TatD DNase family protein
MIIDTHSHLNFNSYKDDVNEVIKRCLDNDVWMINVGSQYNTSKRAVELAENHSEGVYAAIGLHPIHLETGLVKIKDDPDEIQFKTIEEDFDDKIYRELAKSKKVVAIGEIGLDYYWKPKTTNRKEQFKEKQKNILFKQLNLAKELDLPVILHCRMAHEEMINLLKEYGEIKGVVHCFTGNLNQAKEYIEMGLYLGLNGIIFKLNIDEVIKEISIDKFLIETDCPYLTPPSKIGRNEPMYVKYVAEKISEIKNIKLEEIINKTTENAKKLFKI